METTIYMIRHAESPFVFGKERSRGLSDKGHDDAKRVAELLKEVDVDYVASSPYVRAKQTVQYLADLKNLPIIQFENLRERPIKGLELEASWDELLSAIETSFIDLDFALEGGESTRQAQKRAVPIVEKLLDEHRGKNIVIGTHGNIMTIIMNYYDNNFGFDFWNSTSMPDIYKMTFNDNPLLKIDRIEHIH